MCIMPERLPLRHRTGKPSSGGRVFAATTDQRRHVCCSYMYDINKHITYTVAARDAHAQYAGKSSSSASYRKNFLFGVARDYLALSSAKSPAKMRSVVLLSSLVILALASLSAGLVCPDGHTCYDGDTCCIGPMSEWYCCPLPNAICCSDRQHCCPEGYTCNTGAGTCTKQTAKIKLLAVPNFPLRRKTDRRVL